VLPPAVRPKTVPSISALVSVFAGSAFILPLQVEHQAGIGAARCGRGAGGDRAAQQDLAVAARRQRLFDVLDGAAGDPGGAGAADARAAAEDRRQPDRLGEFEQAALVARPLRGDPRFGETDRHRAVAGPADPRRDLRFELWLQRRPGTERLVMDALAAHADPGQSIIERLHERWRPTEIEIVIVQRQ